VMNNKGQVGIIVAILVVTLLASVLVIVQVHYIPKWMKEREAEHMDVVTNQFASLKYSLDLQAMEESSSPLTNSITLGSKELPYFVSSRAFGSLQIISSTTSNFSISVSGRGMESLLATYEKNSGNLTYVLSIVSFEIVINDLEIGDKYNATFYGTTISAEVGNFIGNTLLINLTVINASQIIFNQPVAVGLKAGSSYRINLLNEDYKISTEILPYLSTPFNMTFNASTNGTFVIKCYRYDDSNLNIQYYNSFGIIKYEADNAYFVDQDYIYEGGAVILSQYTGDTLLYPPLLYISNVTKTFNFTLISILAPAGKTAVAGYGTYSIRTNFSSSDTYRCYGYNLTINMTTNYPNAWRHYLENELEKSGMSYSLSSGSNYVKITVTNINLILHIAKVYAQVGPGWVT